jgi:hypothetical protein
MLDLVGWRTNFQKLFGDLTVAVKSLTDQLTDKLFRISQPEAEAKLEEYGQELANSSDEFSNFKTAYREVIEEYLKRFPPTFSNKISDNMREYDKLIVFSLRSGDKTLLSTWGIDHPRSQKLTWIDDPLEKLKYVQRWKDLCKQTPGLKDCYGYLIEHFS